MIMSTPKELVSIGKKKREVIKTPLDYMIFFMLASIRALFIMIFLLCNKYTSTKIIIHPPWGAGGYEADATTVKPRCPTP